MALCSGIHDWRGPNGLLLPFQTKKQASMDVYHVSLVIGVISRPVGGDMAAISTIVFTAAWTRPYQPRQQSSVPTPEPTNDFLPSSA